MFSIAFLRSSSFPLSCRSHSLPLTFLPTPVPCTLKPLSIRFCSLISGCFGLTGISGRTLCFAASLKISACRRNENAGPCHAPVLGFLCGRKGFRVVCEPTLAGLDVLRSNDIVVVDAPILGSEDDVFSAMVTVSICGDVVCCVAPVLVAAVFGNCGGNFSKNRSRRGGSRCASCICRSMIAVVCK